MAESVLFLIEFWGSEKMNPCACTRRPVRVLRGEGMELFKFFFLSQLGPQNSTLPALFPVSDPEKEPAREIPEQGKDGLWLKSYLG